MKRLSGLSYPYRVLAGCLLVSLVPMLIGNMLIIRIFDASLQSQAVSAASKQINEVEQHLNDIIDGCGETAEMIASNSTITRSLIDSTYGLQTDTNLALYRAGLSMYPGSVLSLYDVGGVRRFSTDNSTSYATLPVRWGVLRKAESSNGMVFYNIENFSGLVPPFAMHTARGLFTPDGIMVGYIVVSLPASLFQSAFTGLYTDSGDILLVDAFGGIVFSSRASVPQEELELLRKRLLYGGDTVMELDDQMFFLQENLLTGYHAVLRQSRPFTGDNIRIMREVQLLTGLLSLVLCVLFCIFISRSLSRPVNRLSEAMERIKRGDLDIRVDTGRMDQLGRLAADFNTMAEELQLYMEKIVRQQREMNESQIRLLQAQLNPHFLYNTLDTIKWLAKINKIPEIASISSNLAIILRQCVSSDDFVTLGQELDMIRGYIDIQRVRFSGRFRYVVNIPETLLVCMVPKLILQPVVENAIIHGLADKDDGHVYIYAFEENGNLLISVTDDGRGMPQSAVGRLNRPDSHIIDGHLGLYNISRIIKINYGDSYGLQYNSIENVGTTVMMKIPVRKGEA